MYPSRTIVPNDYTVIPRRATISGSMRLPAHTLIRTADSCGPSLQAALSNRLRPASRGAHAPPPGPFGRPCRQLSPRSQPKGCRMQYLHAMPRSALVPGLRDFGRSAAVAPVSRPAVVRVSKPALVRGRYKITRSEPLGNHRHPPFQRGDQILRVQL